MQLNYSTKIHLLIPIPNDVGWGICLQMWKPVKEVVLKILNSSRVYITHFSPVDPDDRVIMELQCMSLLPDSFVQCVVWWTARALDWINEYCLYHLKCESFIMQKHCVVLVQQIDGSNKYSFNLYFKLWEFKTSLKASTVSPLFKKSSATYLPIPPFPPVIIATFPSSFSSLVHLAPRKYCLQIIKANVFHVKIEQQQMNIS